MLDIKFIRQNPDIVKKATKDKKVVVDVDRLLDLDGKRRQLLSELETKNKERNELARKGAGQADDEKAIAQGRILKEDIEKINIDFKAVDEEFELLLLKIPNISSDDTPVGADESDNKVLRQEGKKPSFDFEPKEHWQIGKELGIIDSETAGEVSGSRFAYLKGGAALLEFALIQHVLSILTNRQTLAEIISKNKLSVSDAPFIPVVPPVFIKPAIFQKMSRLEPADDRYYIPTDDLYLIGSAEHTLGPLHMDQTLSAKQLPVRYAGFSTSFRREAGSYGKDTRGILRLHQFDKVELESFTQSEQAIEEQNFFVAIQEYILQSLGLAYQVVAVCTGDMGAPDARQIDIETWLPGQDRYRETHTADYMSDYQARRLKTKIKRADGTTEFAHMNDATAVAIGRMIIAIIENYQTVDGTIEIPKVLQPYMFGLKKIQ